MKKLFLTVTALLCALILYTQPPQAFKYQAVVRDNSGEILQNQAVGIRISIHDITSGGTIIYQETFNETTNQFGLVNLDIGTGVPTIGTFASIDWSANSKFIETEVDPSGGSTYVSVGISELQSVPYALYSDRSKDAPWENSGNDIYYDNGNVGIGTSSPVYKLQVADPTIGGYVESGVSTDDAAGAIAAYSSTFPAPFTHFAGRVSLWSSAFTATGLDLRADGSSSDIRFYSGGLFPVNERMRITSAGNVGIGITYPSSKCHIRQSSNEILRLESESLNGWTSFYNSNGYIGYIGTYSGDFDLDVGTGSSNINGKLNLVIRGIPRIIINEIGNVGIGTADLASGYLLSVDGKVACEEVLVEYSGSWPDYVFKEGYNLPKIAELEDYIQSTGHLPDMPSARDVEENGFQLADMQKRLLVKVEELTLYTIEQDKLIKKLSQEIDQLNKEVIRINSKDIH
ncbi:MAG: hypothetical protein H8D45_27080 [Bacteroidetes bacterium]|nr:hypothetical protein [Bacteroidota bacterium]MBL7102838.1 hypothetical protein [Bacteroidales bacterium]